MKPLLAYALVIFFAQGMKAQDLPNLPSLRDQLLYAPINSTYDSHPRQLQHGLISTNLNSMEGHGWNETDLSRNMDLAYHITPEILRNELILQRADPPTSLIGGFVTLGSMITAAYYGQKIFDGNNNIKYRDERHRFELTMVVSYSATGLLELFSPSP